MPKQRRDFSGTEKIAILREHLIEKVPISEVCDKHGLQPAMFYQWQKKLFENGAAVFDQPRVAISSRTSIGPSSLRLTRRMWSVCGGRSSNDLLPGN